MYNMYIYIIYKYTFTCMCIYEYMCMNSYENIYECTYVYT